jgi:excinuclease ABC subunit A
MKVLSIRHAKQHNLKNVSCDIPRDKLVVLTGPSGSGKSSLAFDTIYAEGQRRYVESLSAYARQFLEQLAKPDVESIEGLSPAIAIEQKSLGKSPRSTVGTVTEISDYLRLLISRIGSAFCPQCGKPIEAQTVQEIVDRILSLGEGTRLSLLAPLARQRKGELRLELDRLRREGFVRVRIDGQIVDLGDDIVLERQKPHDLEVVVDRLIIKEGLQRRVTDSVELALKLGKGQILVDCVGSPAPLALSEHFACMECEVSLPPIEPRLFSFNNPHGACPQCGGLGHRTTIDPHRCVPNPDRSLRQGAIAAWGGKGSVAQAVELDRAVKLLAVDPDALFKDLPTATQQLLLMGGEATKGRKKLTYDGIVPRLLRRLEGEDPGEQDDDELDHGAVRDDELGRFCTTVGCDHCHGTRLRPEALAVKLDGKDMTQLGNFSLLDLRDFLKNFNETLGNKERSVAAPLVHAMVSRLGFLINVGLDYLTLDRATQTLSGGEGQRIRLATQIGAVLVGVLYVLDEPSVGLHPRDNSRLLEALRKLVDLGNSVLVVEHDREAIMAADYVIDMGPGAGIHGGHIVAEGTPAEIIKNRASVTGPYLTGAKQIELPKRRSAGKNILRIVDAQAHNLQKITVEIPLGLLTSVSGVSGSGKSSLIVNTLLPAVREYLYGSRGTIGPCKAIEGIEQIDKVISIDQSAIGKTPRSNPATYTGIFSLLRDLYAGLPESRARGYKAGRFSFNVKGGRCEACQGDGVRRVEMHFLPDVFVECDVCEGKRYGRETLEVLYRGLSISDSLEQTVEEALALFEAVPRIRERLDALRQVGLGYLQLGQPASTLSGGEAQRVKLARELARRATGQTLYVLDEPTTGLHFADVEQLIASLQALVDAGNTVIVIEHNMDVIASSDYVLDLGPEGGTRGGKLVAKGTPEEVARSKHSYTAPYLKETLERLNPEQPRKRSKSRK